MAGQPGGTTRTARAGTRCPALHGTPARPDGPERPEHGAMARYGRPPEPAQFSRLLADDQGWPGRKEARTAAAGRPGPPGLALP